jgi:hypothetical protein
MKEEILNGYRDPSALYGSSHYNLPAWLRWFTTTVGVHPEFRNIPA